MAASETSNQGKRFALSLRITAEMRAALRDAAAYAGRSVSAEVESRLEKSLAKEEEAWGGPHTKAMMRFLAIAVQSIEESTGKRWIDDPATRDEVLNAIPTIARVFTSPDVTSSIGYQEVMAKGKFVMPRPKRGKGA